MTSKNPNFKSNKKNSIQLKKYTKKTDYEPHIKLTIFSRDKKLLFQVF
jgi:hypothetical protein